MTDPKCKACNGRGRIEKSEPWDDTFIWSSVLCGTCEGAGIEPWKDRKMERISSGWGVGLMISLVLGAIFYEFLPESMVVLGSAALGFGAIIATSYKDIDAVMEAQKDLVEVVHTLKQVLCVKG